LVVPLGVAALLRVFGLDQQLWYDEILTLLESVRHPLGTIVTTYAQNQHALYSVLARVSILAFGEHAWALRLPAVAFGVATVPALYFCARLLTSRREALLACAVLTVSYHHVWFSQNARGYTGLAFFTLLATYFFIRGARGEKSNGAAPLRRTAGMANWVWYAVAVALGAYLHLTMVFVAAGHGIVYLWLVAARRYELGRLPENWAAPLAGFFLSGVLTLAAYAPAFRQMLARTVGQAGTMVKSEWTNPIWVILETIRGLGAGMGIGLAAVAIGGVIFLAGVWSYWRENRYAVMMMALPIVITGIVLQLILNVFPRFFFFAIGFGLMWLVRGAMVVGEWISRRLGGGEAGGTLWGTGVVVLMLAASCYQLRVAYYPKQDFAGAMKYVEGQQRPGDRIVLAGLAAIPYQKYYGRNWTQVETPAQLETIRGQSQATWVLYTLPIHLKSRYPELWHTIESEFPTVKVFRGTMGGGEVIVCRAEKKGG
jgi:4-amino-4-deoxy-L-arabinose transferase-like glycosyltransferase